MSILNVNNLSQMFGDKTVFRSIDFRLLKGEHVGLVGPNGAGKSTLLKVLTGEVIPGQGTVEWFPHIQKGYLEQHIDLNEGTTVRDYLRSAFVELFESEKEMISISSKMGSAGGEILESMLARYADLQEMLEANDFYSTDAKIEEVASGLGINQLGYETDVSKLSGGQRTKLLLAKLLLEKPDLLLLDEPTNYLDHLHIEWLKGYLQSYPNAFILISHDTSFLDRVVNIVYHLEHQTLTRYVGNYRQFEEAYKLRRQQIYQAYAKQQEEIKKLETYIQKNKARASTAKQAKSREKKLEKIDRIDKPVSSPRPHLAFNVSVEPTSVIFEAENLSIGYEEPLFPPVDFKLRRGEKVAITGYNGIGKSTTLKTLLGKINALGGRIHYGQRVLPAYFEQEWAAGERTAIEEIWSVYPLMSQKEIRQALARCGLRSEHIFQPLNALSGGEQSKVRLCHLMLAKSNWLVLDEPTNHLDGKSKEALKEALETYRGTVIVVSHESEFYESWITSAWDVEEWR
ncbi:ABC-F family ATP-binding cassette domain-containing protein [Pseudalkalibacillus caeni]|uniref:ABC-F family ATP-binding cassette domain-containing protein n=1 Tax=Exobacillus caeni TaxID=2574798 RepID=A0A5R9EYS4_9BACL|nr:ABC-F family ATP-binding cassette domain-containing protein [Pseudalkalibacillus caeni]TLS35220.1 ABC-F family ATP-binding cassette domain-containing protein [Pseudalkalibacillus caeni]